jgi:hypothetical protein
MTTTRKKNGCHPYLPVTSAAAVLRHLFVDRQT